MSTFEDELIIQNIITDIRQRCVLNGENVSETFVAYILKGIILCPDSNFKFNQKITKDDASIIIQACIDKIINISSPSNDTLKLQVYFEENQLARNEIVLEHDDQLLFQLKPILEAILDFKPKSSYEFDALFKNIVSYIAKRSSLGDPSDMVVEREISVALKSVLPSMEIPGFISLSRQDKERELRELTLIVSGIRLFNKNAGRGGESILELPNLLNKLIPITSKILDTEIDKIQKRNARLIAVAEKFQRDRIVSDAFTEEQLREAIINCRQLYVYLQDINVKVIESAKRVGLSINQLGTRLTQMKLSISSRSAVPTAQVYPQFMHLAQLWKSFQDEIIVNDVYKKIIADLFQFTKIQYEFVPESCLDDYLVDCELITDSQRQNQYYVDYHMHDADLTRRIEPRSDEDITILYEESTTNFNQIKLEFRGICCHTMVSKNRLLIPGNPLLGIVSYKNKYYSFVSIEAANDFITDPEIYIREVIMCAKKSIELIQLLNLHELFEQYLPASQQTSKASNMIESTNRKITIKQNSGTQTDTHFVESNIVKSYEWNEWQLRRNAVKMANLRSKVTHSSQTAMSFSKKDNSTQIYLPKNTEMQTNSDKGTNVPKPETYLWGLRGVNPTEYEKVDLTLDICD